jgi:hypothetical protein
VLALSILLVQCSPFQEHTDCRFTIEVPPLEHLLPLGQETAFQWDPNAYMERADITVVLNPTLGDKLITTFIFHAEDKRAALLITVAPDGVIESKEVEAGQRAIQALGVAFDQGLLQSQEVFQTAANAACDELGNDSIDSVTFTLLRDPLERSANPVWRVAFFKVNQSTVYATLDAITGEVIDVKD